jgi:hypothetical protein
MTAFSTADLPTTVNTVEKLLLWANTVLQHLNPDLTAVEETGRAELMMQSAPFFISAVSPAEWRVISRSSLRISADWQRVGKIWNHAAEISTKPIPTEFRS